MHTHSGDDILLKCQGSDLTPEFIEQHGFKRPILVKQKEGLKLKVPPPEFRIMDVERYVGKEDGKCRCVRDKRKHKQISSFFLVPLNCLSALSSLFPLTLSSLPPCSLPCPPCSP